MADDVQAIGEEAALECGKPTSGASIKRHLLGAIAAAITMPVGYSRTAQLGRAGSRRDVAADSLNE